MAIKTSVFFLLPLAFSSSVPLGLWGITSLVIIITVLILGLVYAVGQAFNSPTTLAWVKENLIELFNSVLLLVLVSGVYEGYKTLYPWGSGDYNEKVEWVINSLLFGETGFFDILRDMLQAILKVYGDVYASSTFSFSSMDIGVTVAQWSISLALSLLSMIPGIGSIFSSLAKLVGGGWYRMTFFSLLSGASSFFPYITQAAVFAINQMNFWMLLKEIWYVLGEEGLGSFILAFGYALRILPFTRKTGSTIIAFSLSFLMFYPLALGILFEIKNGFFDGSLKEFHRKVKIDNIQKPFIEEQFKTLAFLVSNLFCGNRELRVLLSGGGLGELGWSIAFCPVGCAVYCAAYTVAYGVCYLNCILNSCPELIGGWVYPIASTVLTFTGTYFSADIERRASDIISAAVARYINHILLPYLNQLAFFSTLSFFFSLLTLVFIYAGWKAFSHFLGGEITGLRVRGIV